MPRDARTREHLEWAADQVIETGGTALLLRAQTLTRKDERALATSMSQARAGEYRELAAHAAEVEAEAATPGEWTRALKRLRSDLRKVKKRDYFPPAERDQAVAAVNRLATELADSQLLSRSSLGDRS